LDDKKIAFRNKVIHQGYMPTVDEAIEYGEYVINFVSENLFEMKKIDTKAYSSANIWKYLRDGNLASSAHIRSFSNVPTLIDFDSQPGEKFEPIALKERLESMSKNSFYKRFYRKSI
jgi:hypothetical protein